MSLPLMPGTEPVQAFVPLAHKPEPTLDYPGGVIARCGCAMCRRGRATGPTYSAPPAAHFAAAYGATPSVIQNLLADYPTVHPPGLVRGTYDFSQRTDNQRDSALHGEVRWLNVRTGECFDLTGSRQWTFSLYGDVWADRNGTRFIPDAPAPAPVFDWEATAQSEHPVPTRVQQAGVNAGRVRGQYDPTHPESGLFLREYRWLDARTGVLYDARGHRCNEVRQVQGRWQTVGGLTWVPV